MQSYFRRHGSVPTLVFLICFSFFLAPARSGATAGLGPPADSSAGADGYRLDESLLHEKVGELLGVPYRWGGSTRAGMDCSGFSRYMYSRLFGVELPHKASLQYRLGIFRDTSKESPQTGDLIFFAQNNVIDHVGIYLADGKFVHSVGRKGVVISSLDNPYWKSLLAGSRRLMGLEDDSLDDVSVTHTFADVHFDEWNSLRLRFSLLLQNERPFREFTGRSPWTTFPGSPSNPYGDTPFGFEIGYQRRLAMDSVNIRMSAFWERSCFEEAVTLFPATFGRGTSPFGNPDPRTFHQSGLNLASEIGLFQGFRIRPFFSLIERSAMFEDNRGDTLGVLGLEALVAPPFGSYDLSLAVDYADRLESDIRPLNVTGSTNEWGMSLRFRYRVTDLMRISLAGQHAFGDLSESPVGSTVRSRAASDFRFLFDLSY